MYNLKPKQKLRNYLLLANAHDASLCAKTSYCRFQPVLERYVWADRIKTPALGEVPHEPSTAVFLSEREHVCTGISLQYRRDLPQPTSRLCIKKGAKPVTTTDLAPYCTYHICSYSPLFPPAGGYAVSALCSGNVSVTLNKSPSR